jgi:membrane-associated phospholipid phosphatase
VFPFIRFPGVDTILGPEMKSTGEVMGGAMDFGHAFVKAMLGAGQRLPEQGTVCLSVNNDDKPEVVPIAKALSELGFSLVGTRGTAVYLRAHGVDCGVVFKVNEGRPNLADEIVEQETLTQFDLALATALHENATPAQVAVFKEITKLGNVSVVVVLGLGVSLVLLIRRRWLLLASWVITLAGGTLLNLLLKAHFQRVRPEFADPFVNESGWSFPSGHAMISLITYGMGAYLLMLALSRPLKQVVVVVTVTLVLLIGFSRLYLGAHYFSDVLAGYAAGALWLAVTISGTEVARRRQRAQATLSSAAEVELNSHSSLKV